jgi:outer membrane protein assembly factor BamB
MRSVIVLTLLACVSCGGGHGLRITAVSGDAAAATMLFADGDRLIFDGKTVARVAYNGRARWQIDAPGWLVSSPDSEELWFIDTDAHRSTTVVRVAAMTGAVLSQSGATSSIGHWVSSRSALYRVDSYTVDRVDPRTGSPLWSVHGAFVEHEPQAAPNALWIRCGGGVCGFAAVNGAPIATLPAANWPMLTPDGTTLVLQARDAALAYDSTTGALQWSAPVPTGSIVAKTAVSDRWVAILSSDADHVDRLQVVTRATGAPVWSIIGTRGHYLEYIAAGGNLVAWYDDRDSSIRVAHMPDGATARVMQLHEGFVFSIDASGVAPAIPDHAPSILDNVVRVTRFDNVFAFRVRNPDGSEP